MAENDNILNEGVSEQEQQAVLDDIKNRKASAAKKSKGEKPPKMTKSEKKAARADAKEKSRSQKEWEDSIVASKRVKREERRRKLRKAMVLLLVISLTVTSVVYVMLLFIENNNVRITASSSADDKTISLSMDNISWTPYLMASGPQHMWDISYNPIYNRGLDLPTRAQAKYLLETAELPTGDYSGENFICFGFMLRNSSSGQIQVPIVYEVAITSDYRGLENAIRVMWTERFNRDETGLAESTVYAALSDNPKLAEIGVNKDRTAEQGYIEKVAYPIGSDQRDFDLAEWEENNKDSLTDMYMEESGYFDAVPFYSDSQVLYKERVLQPGEIMFVHIAIWIEGSDFDCVDAALGGYVTMNVNFVAGN